VTAESIAFQPHVVKELGMSRAIATVLAFCGLAGPSMAQNRAAPDRWQPIRDSIGQQLVRVGGTGLAVAVAKDGKIIWEQGFGWADREKMVPVTEHTMFSLASISKPITATGLMVLAERGQIDLDRPANDYLGAGKLTGLAGDASGATVRRVLSHTAGLPLHYQFFYQNEAVRPPTMDETIARYGNLVSAPGETFRYSNLGYGILDYLISRIGRASYHDFMRTEVFLPLGLTRTSIDIGPGLEPYAAQRYDRQTGRLVPWYTFDHNGGSAVYMSAHDLVRFGMFHLKARLPDQRAILKDASIDAMQRVEASAAFGDSTAGYGLGWGVHKSDRGYPLVEHTGGMPGVATVLNLYPTERLAIVVLSNGPANPFSLAEDIAAVMLPRYADSLRAERARPARPPGPKFVAPAELIGTWTGTLRTWERQIPFGLTIDADGDVKAQIGTAPTSMFDFGPEKQLPALVSDLAWREGTLTGALAGQIPTPDAGRVPHVIGLTLRLVGGRLRGEAAALSTTNPIYFALASYVDLTRK
jgi:CubicO group peptidase (beta-lactamase class C family)